MPAVIHDNPRELPGRGLASSRRTDWSAISGLLLCISWAPMAIVILRLPDLGSAPEIERFWRENLGLVQAVILSTSVGFIFLLVFLGGLAERVYRVDPGLAFTAFGSALMFMTALNVALGLDVASGLLSERGPIETTYALHNAAFLLAAPAAPVGAAFFVAVAVASFRRNVFSRSPGVARGGRRRCQHRRTWRDVLAYGPAELGQRRHGRHRRSAGPLSGVDPRGQYLVVEAPVPACVT